MKIVATIISLVLTFFFSNMFSIYRPGTVPTPMTSVYLVVIFAIFECISLAIGFAIKNIKK